jgi:hypothetical protein
MKMRLRTTHMSSPLSLLAAMERGLLRRRHATNLTPQKSHQDPYIQQSQAATHAPPKHKQGVAAHICPNTPPSLIPTLPPNVWVVNTPINLREPESVLGFTKHMCQDYSKNALAVREQRDDDFYHYLKGEGLEARFWCDFHRDFYQIVIRNPKLVAKNMGAHCEDEVH